MSRPSLDSILDLAIDARRLMRAQHLVTIRPKTPNERARVRAE